MSVGDINEIIERFMTVRPPWTRRCHIVPRPLLKTEREHLGQGRPQSARPLSVSSLSISREGGYSYGLSARGNLRDQSNPRSFVCLTDRAGAVLEGGEGVEPFMLGAAVVVGLGSGTGALGDRTGSRNGRSLSRRPPVHPVTNNRVAATAARRTVVFISRLLRE